MPRRGEFIPCNKTNKECNIMDMYNLYYEIRNIYRRTCTLSMYRGFLNLTISAV
jgi:hypothetical protein